MSHEADLPSGWRWVKLEDVCQVVTGGTPPRDTPSFFGGDIPWVKPEDLDHAVFVSASREYLTDAGARVARVIPSGSIMVSCIGNIGKLGIAGRHLATNQQINSLIPSKNVDPLYLYYACSYRKNVFQRLASASLVSILNKSTFSQVEIPLAPLNEQRHIATLLREQMEAVERARVATDEQQCAAHALPAAILRSVFGCAEARAWPVKRLGDALSLRKDVVHPRDNPSGQATFVGLEHIQGLTGRRLGGIEVEMSKLTGRKPRFYAGDIVYGYLRPYLNKVWLAEFDGLCSVDQYVYAVSPERADARYIAWFMRSSAYLENAPINASPGQLPRIRTEEVASVRLPLPSLAEQRMTVERIEAQMQLARSTVVSLESRIEAIKSLPAELLRQAFSGELSRTESAFEFPNRPRPKDSFAAQGLVSCYAVARLHPYPTFGDVQHAKVGYLAEAHLGIDLGGRYKRMPAGPLDKRIYPLIGYAKKQGWYIAHPRESGKGHFYTLGPNIQAQVDAASAFLGDKKSALDDLLDTFATQDTESIEILATLYAAWNDFLLDGTKPSDADVIREVRENWHESKRRFTPERLQAALHWMRDTALVPRGVGPSTVVRAENRAQGDVIRHGVR